MKNLVLLTVTCVVLAGIVAFFTHTTSTSQVSDSEVGTSKTPTSEVKRIQFSIRPRLDGMK